MHEDISMAQLTDAERSVLAIYGLGYSIQYTADFVGLDRKTTQQHISSIYAKLNVNNKDQLINASVLYFGHFRPRA